MEKMISIDVINEVYNQIIDNAENGMIDIEEVKAILCEYQLLS